VPGGKVLPVELVVALDPVISLRVDHRAVGIDLGAAGRLHELPAWGEGYLAAVVGRRTARVSAIRRQTLPVDACIGASINNYGSRKTQNIKRKISSPAFFVICD
jgi:hypothetical protein